MLEKLNRSSANGFKAFSVHEYSARNSEILWCRRHKCHCQSELWRLN